jgi:predicted CXXCH cytochrome family protein
VALAAAAALAAAGAAGARAPPEVVPFPALNGTIAFTHRSHYQVYVPRGCRACHEHEGIVRPAVTRAYGKEGGHAFCVGCHEQRGAGPVRCSQCHDPANGRAATWTPPPPRSPDAPAEPWPPKLRPVAPTLDVLPAEYQAYLARKALGHEIPDLFVEGPVPAPVAAPAPVPPPTPPAAKPSAPVAATPPPEPEPEPEPLPDLPPPPSVPTTALASEMQLILQIEAAERARARAVRSAPAAASAASPPSAAAAAATPEPARPEPRAVKPAQLAAAVPEPARFDGDVAAFVRRRESRARAIAERWLKESGASAAPAPAPSPAKAPARPAEAAPSLTPARSEMDLVREIEEQEARERARAGKRK